MTLGERPVQDSGRPRIGRAPLFESRCLMQTVDVHVAAFFVCPECGQHNYCSMAIDHLGRMHGPTRARCSSPECRDKERLELSWYTFAAALMELGTNA